MELQKLNQIPHRRYNPLMQQWVLVSPHRTERPWLGQTEEPERQTAPRYDPNCYLCPGNARAGGARNPDYSSTFVFDNDFAALRPDIPRLKVAHPVSDLLIAESEPGICRVVCFSPHHDLTMGRMKEDEIRDVVDVWIEQYRSLGGHEDIQYVQIFENRGAMMGASNPHPHGQIWANHSVPNVPLREQQSLHQYRQKHRRCLLCDYARLEDAEKERIVCQNDFFLVVVPFWAEWPFETLLLSRRHVRDFAELEEQERSALAGILRRLATRYDNLFQSSFPYSMGSHQRPTDGEEHPECHLHAHFFPPLLRSATVRKFVVGYELLASSQRDMTPEDAAARLRGLPEEHYLRQV
ncbi:MAG: UDP-glucose--hexose-1-phosphate uridylyltransferase [Candidatus Sulfotelmatobacter sp.]